MKKLAMILMVTCGLLVGLTVPATAQPGAGISLCTLHAWAPVRWDNEHVMGDSTVACSQQVHGLNLRSTVWYSWVHNSHYITNIDFNNYPANPLHEDCTVCGGLGAEAVSFISEPASGCYWFWTRAEAWTTGGAVITVWGQSATTFCQL